MRPARATLVIVIASAAGVVAASLGGCAAQGTYTGELADEAISRMDGLRSDTELDFARQAFEARRLDRAEQRARSALAINPDSAGARLVLARVAIERGRFAEAAAHAEASIELGPGDAESHYVLGVALERRGVLEAARAAFSRAVELDPGDAHAALALAETLHMLGREREAEAMLLGWDGQAYHAGAQQLLGQFAMARGDVSTAIARLESARTAAPADLGIIEDLAAAQLAAGRYAEAEANLASLRASPGLGDRPDLVRQHAGCLRALGKLAEARDLYLSLAESAPSPERRARLWSVVGELSYRAGDQPVLRRAASRAVEADPQRADGYVLWALWYLRDGEPGRVRESIEAGAARASDPADLELLSRALEGLGGGEGVGESAPGGALAGVETDG